MKNLQLSFSCLICFLTIHISAQTSLVNPLRSNNFIADYTLPDGTVRVIGSEHGRERELFFVDRHTDGTVGEPVFFPESIGELEFNFAGVDAKVLPLRNGDVILGINQSDCDFSPYSSIARFDITGNVLWAQSVEELGFYFFIEELTQVDSNVVVVISDEGDTLFLTTDGIVISADPKYTAYDTTTLTNTGYLASRDKSIFVLDQSFTVVDSLQFDTPVTVMISAGDSLIFVTTETFMVVLDDTLGLRVFTAFYEDLDFLAVSPQGFWGAKKHGDIYEWDYKLSIQDTHQLNSSIHLLGIRAVNNEIVLSGHYIGALASSVFFHAASEAHFSFSIRKDISIDTVVVDQPIFYEFEMNAFPWGFNIPYTTPVATVMNTGLDTIHHFIIAYKEWSTCLFCEPFQLTWEYNIRLDPGESAELDLGDFEAFCVGRDPKQFCLSIYPADNLPEADGTNNRLCRSVDAFFVATEEAADSSYKIYPNPVDNLLTIQSEESFSQQAHLQLIDMNGRVLMRLDVRDTDYASISVQDLNAGFYILAIGSPNQSTVFHKIVVQH